MKKQKSFIVRNWRVKLSSKAPSKYGKAVILRGICGARRNTVADRWEGGMNITVKARPETVNNCATSRSGMYMVDGVIDWNAEGGFTILADSIHPYNGNAERVADAEDMLTPSLLFALHNLAAAVQNEAVRKTEALKADTTYGLESPEAYEAARALDIARDIVDLAEKDVMAELVNAEKAIEEAATE